MSVPKNAAFSSMVWKAPCCGISVVNIDRVSIKNERTYTKLRRGIDELQLDLLEIPAGSVDHERLPEGDDTLLGTGNRALEEEEIVLDDTIVREATHGRDLLLGNVRLGGGVGSILTRANSVNLLVKFSAVVVTVWYRITHSTKVSIESVS